MHALAEQHEPKCCAHCALHPWASVAHVALRMHLELTEAEQQFSMPAI
jgi:hypothetical protein